MESTSYLCISLMTDLLHWPRRLIPFSVSEDALRFGKICVVLCESWQVVRNVPSLWTRVEAYSAHVSRSVQMSMRAEVNERPKSTIFILRFVFFCVCSPVYQASTQAPMVMWSTGQSYMSCDPCFARLAVDFLFCQHKAPSDQSPLI